jgi:hypothetical protein
LGTKTWTINRISVGENQAVDIAEDRSKNEKDSRQQDTEREFSEWDMDLRSCGWGCSNVRKRENGDVVEQKISEKDFTLVERKKNKRVKNNRGFERMRA